MEDCGLCYFGKLVGVKLRKNKRDTRKQCTAVRGRGKLNLKVCAVLMKACSTEKEKKRKLDDLNHFDKLCLLQYEGYKRQNRHKLGGSLDGLRQDIFATSKYISLQLGKAKICL